jgi:hypothetical protein
MVVVRGAIYHQSVVAAAVVEEQLFLPEQRTVIT